MSLNIQNFKSLLDTTGFAQPNKYKIMLPTVNFGTAIDMEELNLLCDEVNLPGKQILTNERQIGVKFEKMVNGYAVDDLSLTFYLTNNYNAKRYFEEWSQSAITYNRGEVVYKNEYVKDFSIFQLDTEGNEIYGCKIFEAFPTTLNPVQMANQLTDVTRYNVQLSYTDWEPIPQEQLKIVVEG